MEIFDVVTKLLEHLYFENADAFTFLFRSVFHLHLFFLLQSHLRLKAFPPVNTDPDGHPIEHVGEP